MCHPQGGEADCEDRVPGIFINLRGVSPLANLIEVKASEAQEYTREGIFEGSV